VALGTAITFSFARATAASNTHSCRRPIMRQQPPQNIGSLERTPPTATDRKQDVNSNACPRMGPTVSGVCRAGVRCPAAVAAGATHAPHLTQPTGRGASAGPNVQMVSLNSE
jgi:hypothetical protein